MGCYHGIAVCNDPVVLELAIAALRIGHGDEVILPAFTIISCEAAIVRAGLTPVVVSFGLARRYRHGKLLSQ
jgi:perosamine synthetase